MDPRKNFSCKVCGYVMNDKHRTYGADTPCPRCIELSMSEYVLVDFLDASDDVFGKSTEFLNQEVFSREYFENIKGGMNVVSVQPISKAEADKYNCEASDEIAVDVGEFVKGRLKKKLHIK